MCMHFNTKTDKAQNLIDDYFSNFRVYESVYIA